MRDCINIYKLNLYSLLKPNGKAQVYKLLLLKMQIHSSGKTHTHTLELMCVHRARGIFCFTAQMQTHITHTSVHYLTVWQLKKLCAGF